MVCVTLITDPVSSIRAWHRKNKQPDWFKDKATFLEPLFKKKNDLYTKWLSTGNAPDRQRFSEARSVAQSSVRQAKNICLQDKTQEAQKSRRTWKCTRDMHRGRSGLIRIKTTTIKYEYGNLYTSISAQQQQWRRHFTKVLNVVSTFDLSEVENTRQRPLRPELAALPSSKDLDSALLHCKIENLVFVLKSYQKGWRLLVLKRNLWIDC